ncbi:XPG N-terminal domain-containing protein [Entamoeba marina]
MTKFKNSCIIVDSDSILFELLYYSTIEVHGILNYLKCISNKLNIQFIFIFDGMYPTQKLNELIKRKQQKIQEINKVFNEPFQLNRIKYKYPSTYDRYIMLLLTFYGFETIHSNYESDSLIPKYAHYYNSQVIVSCDSDFYILDIPYVINTQSFIKTLYIYNSNFDNIHLKVQIKFKVYDTAYIKNTLINIQDTLLPIFSVLTGNDYSIHFYKELCKEIGIQYENDDEIITSVIKWLQNKTSFDDVQQFIQTTVNKESYDLFNEAIQMTLNTSSKQYDEKEEQFDIDIDPWVYIHCKKLHSIARHGCFQTVPLFSELYIHPLRKSPYVISIPLRQFIYGLYDINNNIQEIYQKDGDLIINNPCKPLEHLGLSNFLKHSRMQRISIVLNELNITNQLLIELWDMCLTDNNEWKAVLLTSLYYWKIYGDYTIDELFHFFHTFMIMIYNNYSYSSNPNADYRLPLHLYSSYFLILWHFAEILIDICDISTNFILVIMVDIQNFCKAFDVESNSVVDIDNEAQYNEMYYYFKLLFY